MSDNDYNSRDGDSPELSRVRGEEESDALEEKLRQQVLMTCTFDPIKSSCIRFRNEKKERKSRRS